MASSGQASELQSLIALVKTLTNVQMKEILRSEFLPVSGVKTTLQLRIIDCGWRRFTIFLFCPRALLISHLFSNRFRADVPERSNGTLRKLQEIYMLLYPPDTPSNPRRHTPVSVSLQLVKTNTNQGIFGVSNASSTLFKWSVFLLR
jgi:hypothetical protein